MGLTKSFISITPALLFLTLCFHISSICWGEAIPPSVHDFYVKDLYSTNQIDQAKMADQWTLSGIANSNQPRTAFCFDTYILGGPGLINPGGYVERTYSPLPSHNMIYYAIRIYVIDDWKEPDMFTVQFDSMYPLVFNPVPAKPFYEFPRCGSSSVGDINDFYILGKVLHSGNSLKLKVLSNMQQTPDLASLGVRFINLLFVNKTLTDTEQNCVGLQGTFGIGNCNCPSGRYYTSSNTCSNCHSSCGSCFGPSDTECYSCNLGFYWNGVKCTSCPSNCMLCSSGSQCTHCYSGYILYWNNTCKTAGTCSPPYIKDGDGVFQVCKTPCDSNAYMYWDNTCAPSCDTPLVQRIQGSANFCDYPCATSQYLNWDGSCSSTCSLYPRVWMYRQFCDPCPSNFFMYPDGTCGSTCDPPFSIQTAGSAKLCKTLCPTNQYLLGTNGSVCIPTCNSPLVAVVIKGVNVCSFPCKNPAQEFLYWNGSCLTTCKFIQRFSGGYQFCEPCPSGFLYFDGSCRQTCDPPLQNFIKGGFAECYYPCGRSPLAYSQEDYVSCSDLYTYPYRMTSSGLCVLDFEESEDRQSKTVASVLNKFGIIVSGVAIVTLFINPKDPRPFCLLLSIKMLEYLKFIKALYPAKIQQVFNFQRFGQGMTAIAPTLSIDAQSSFENNTMPDQFALYGLHSSFLVNSWQPIISLLIIIALIILVCLIERCIKEFKFVKWMISKVKSNISWATMCLYLLMTTYFSDFVIYTSIEFRTLHFTSFLPVLSFLIMLFINVLIGFTMFKVFKAFKEVRKGTTQVKDINSGVSAPPNQALIRNYIIFFDACKDKGYFHQIFIIAFLIRVLLYNFILAYLFDHPFVQTFFVTFISILMILYIQLQKPLKDSTYHLQFILGELILLLANVCAFVLSIINATCGQSFGFRGILGGIIIACNFLLIILGGGCLVATIINKAFGDQIRDYLRLRQAEKDLRKASSRLSQEERPVVRSQTSQVAPWATTTPKFEPKPTQNNLKSHLDSTAMLQIDQSNIKNQESEIEMSGLRRNDSSIRPFAAGFHESRLINKPADLSYNFANNDDSMVGKVPKYNFDTKDLETLNQGNQGSMSSFELPSYRTDKKQNRDLNKFAATKNFRGSDLS